MVLSLLCRRNEVRNNQANLRGFRQETIVMNGYSLLQILAYLIQTFLQCACIIYRLEGSEITNNNLVTNGDFEQRNTSFISDYTYCNQSNGWNNN